MTNECEHPDTYRCREACECRCEDCWNKRHVGRGGVVSRDRCRYPGPVDCFGYVGPYDTYTCLAPNHDQRTEEANGRQPCQAGDLRWADPGFSTCRFHREYDPAVRGAR